MRIFTLGLIEIANCTLHFGTGQWDFRKGSRDFCATVSEVTYSFEAECLRRSSVYIAGRTQDASRGHKRKMISTRRTNVITLVLRTRVRVDSTRIFCDCVASAVAFCACADQSQGKGLRREHEIVVFVTRTKRTYFVISKFACYIDRYEREYVWDLWKNASINYRWCATMKSNFEGVGRQKYNFLHSAHHLCIATQTLALAA